MQAATGIEPTVEPEVFEVLRKNKADAAFQTACEVARSSFPKMISLHVDLLEDPDVDGRAWVSRLYMSRRGPVSRTPNRDAAGCKNGAKSR